jgi:drug/metabolite transporter (DMT)-like permease
MHHYAVLIVLLSAILHATWNAQLKGSGDRTQFMAAMCVATGALAALFLPFVPIPARAAWWCVGLSTFLHIGYNLLLLENYRKSDLGSAYPIARGISPLLVTLGGFALMGQRPNAFAIAGVTMISAGIVFLSTDGTHADRFAILSALATGIVIAAYTVVDGMGVQRTQNTLSYTTWLFASYLLMPLVLLLLRRPIRPNQLRSLPLGAGAGLFSLIAYTLVLWATHYADVGVVSALRETSVLWAVLIGSVFLRERFRWRRMVSAVVICLGVFLLVAKSG